MDNFQKKISVAELARRPNTYPSIIAKSKKPDDILIDSKLRYTTNYDGLSISVSRHTEMNDFSSTGEIPAAIGFNIIFAGTIDFSIGGIPYTLGTKNTERVECASYIINQPEIFTRHLRQGRTASYIKILANRQWLESRANSVEAKHTVQRLFQLHNVVNYWKPPNNIIQSAKKLLKHPPSSSLKNNLLNETLAIEFFSYCLEKLDQLTEKTSSTNDEYKASNYKNIALKKSVDKLLLEHMSLDDIAASLGLSVSTLQRKFKAASGGITVNHYCRQRRLQIARRALTVDGASIGEAAYLAGYNHPSNFITAFKKLFNLTPSDLVKQHS